jgi:predicted DsbA family dithiol-disulfide isomerase
MSAIEVWADITCPFAYVGLRHVVDHLAEVDGSVAVIVRSWPLEWVNGTGLAFDGVEAKAAALREQLGVDLFNGLAAESWPSSTIPALALAAAAYDLDNATGLAVSQDLRRALFELDADISDVGVLHEIGRAHGVEFDPGDDRAVRADYENGQARGVRGSPHYFVADTDFFCPALDLGHDAENHLTARFDPDNLARFLASIPH